MNKLPVDSPNSPFLPGTQFQFAWDSTSLGYLKTCPRKYYLTMIEGWRKKEESVHLIFGSHFHSALEFYDHAKAKGATHEDAVHGTTRKLFELVWNNGERWNPDNSPKKNPFTLFRTVLWYLAEYANDPAKTLILANGRPAVELSFRFESGITKGGKEILLSGHMDRIVEFGEINYVMDRKTTGAGIGSYFFAGFNPDNQMSLYTLASRVVYQMPVQGVIIDAANILVGATDYARGITMRSSGQLDEWLSGFSQWVDTAAQYAEVQQWPMNEASCGNYGGCVFRGICSKDASIREKFLETDFEHRFWNPLETR